MDPKIMPKIAIIILNWNEYQETVDCLEHLIDLESLDTRLIVLDNGSEDGSFDQITEWAASQGGRLQELPIEQSERESINRIIKSQGPFDLTLLAGKTNFGFSEGCNLAIRYALKDPKVKYVYLLNNDAFPEPGAISEIIRIAKTHSAEVTGSVIRESQDGRIVFAGSDIFGEVFSPLIRSRRKYMNLEDQDDCYAVGMVPGSAMLIKRNILKERLTHDGYVFIPDLFMYCEELEFCIWAKRRGYKVSMATKSNVVHDRSSGTKRASSYFTTRNHILLVANYFDRSGLRVAFHLYYPAARLILALYKLIQGNWKISKAIVKGLVDGYRRQTGQPVWHKGQNF